MKTLKPLLTILALTFVFWSCKEDLIKATLKKDIVPNVLQAPSSSSFVLTSADKANVMETFHWTKTDFGFNAAVSYTLQIAIASTAFEGAIDVATTNALSAAVNVGDFNDMLLGLGLVPEEATNIDIRVVSRLNNSIDPVYSNTITISVTDYATSFPPIWGMGAALKGLGPWPDNAVEWQSTEFKKYQTVTHFTNGETFRWFAQLDCGPTSYNYPFFTTVDPLFVNANDGDSNLKVAGATGWYQINVDLASKTVTAAAVDEPVLYMMGAALNGWGPWPSAAVKMDFVKPGIFEADATFSNEIFRFFAQADWGPTSYSYPYFTSVDANFALNPSDGDNNLRFIGTPGVQHITVDLNAKTVTLGTPPDPVLFMMGDGLNGWGPWHDKEVIMHYDGSNTFSATTDFAGTGAWRFFAQQDWGPTSYNYPFFTTVDSEFVNANDGDSNLHYVGTPGSRTIHVNMDTKVVTLD